jgi:hypothetical protein
VEVLERNRQIIEAEERLKTGEVGDEDLYDVVLLATGDVEVAEESLYARMRIRAKQAPTMNLDGE